MQVNSATLPNGLRIFHHHDPSTAMVVVNLLYNVGARDEHPTSTGIAHLFEHLMFGGSRHVPSYDQAIESAGGVNNAWTSNDFTSFYDILPAHNAETAFWAESDRIAWLNLTPESLEVQRQVVIEEFKQQCLNRPYGDIAHHLRRMVYTTHPYRWPVIGLTPNHIAEFTLDQARQFYHSHYLPNNASLIVAGNITLDRTLELAHRWFGDIPAGQVAPRLYAPEPPQTSARELRVDAPVPHTMLIMAYPMGPFDMQQYIAADTITDILSAGRSARLTRELLNTTDLFTAIDASITGSDEPGMLMITARLSRNTDHHITQARQAITDTLQRLIEQGVGDHELRRTVNRCESTFTFSNVDLLTRAQNIANYHSRAIDINTVIPAYRALTPADITDAARAILRPTALNTLIYGPTPH